MEVLAGVPAFGGENQSGSLFQAGALTAHGARNDFASETFCVAPTLAGGGRKSGGYSLDDIPTVAGTLQANGKAAGSATQQDAEAGLLVVHGTQDPDVVQDCAHTLGRNHGQENAVFDPNQITSVTNRSQPTPGLCHTLPASSQPPIAFSCKDYGADAGDVSPTLRAMGHGESHGQPIVADVAPTLRSGNFRSHSNPATQADSLVIASAVRRLTPRECERLQGFPDDYTLIPWRGKPATECPDGPRYKSIGNSKAVPVVRWIGRRLKAHLEKLS